MGHSITDTEGVQCNGNLRLVHGSNLGQGTGHQQRFHGIATSVENRGVPGFILPWLNPCHTLTTQYCSSLRYMPIYASNNVLRLSQFAVT